MKKLVIVLLVLGVLLVVGGITGAWLVRDRLGVEYCGDSAGYGFQNCDDEFYSYRGRGMWNDDGARYSRRADISGRSADIKGDALDLHELEDAVNDYIADYGEDLVISDIFVYSDSDYYFSIMEEGTGMGAMELLVDPVTAAIQPEFGPNMMWNIKYGMHGGSAYGMRGRMGRGMMGGYYQSYDIDDFEGNTVTYDEAKVIAEEFAQENIDKDYDVPGDGHEFYGYYTFHIENDGETVGMLSVNGLTGEVWYHTWHGTLVEVVAGEH